MYKIKKNKSELKTCFYVLNELNCMYELATVAIYFIMCLPESNVKERFAMKDNKIIC